VPSEGFSSIQSSTPTRSLSALRKTPVIRRPGVTAANREVALEHASVVASRLAARPFGQLEVGRVAQIDVEHRLQVIRLEFTSRSVSNRSNSSRLMTFRRVPGDQYPATLPSSLDLYFPTFPCTDVPASGIPCGATAAGCYVQAEQATAVWDQCGSSIARNTTLAATRPLVMVSRQQPAVGIFTIDG
jgi:hypothetical protein